MLCVVIQSNLGGTLTNRLHERQSRLVLLDLVYRRIVEARRKPEEAS